MSATRAHQDLRLAWVGFHQEGIPALVGLLERGVRPEAVVTLDKTSIAKRSAGADYEEALREWDVPIHEVSNINDESSVALLRSLNLDVLFVIGWSQILRAEALASARIGVVGAHASLLPHNRGSAPINWAIIRGEQTTGNSLIWLDEGVDEGRIIDQTEFAITPFDTCATLYERVAESNRVMIERLLPKLMAGEVPGHPQPLTDEPTLPRRRPSDGLIDWDAPARGVYDLVRALTRPYPGAFSYLQGRKWTVQSSALLPGPHDAGGPAGVAPGTVVGPCLSPVAEACGIVVRCGEGSVVLLEIEDDRGEVLKGRALCHMAMGDGARGDWTGEAWSNE